MSFQAYLDYCQEMVTARGGDYQEALDLAKAMHRYQLHLPGELSAAVQNLISERDEARSVARDIASQVPHHSAAYKMVVSCQSECPWLVIENERVHK